MPLPPVKSGDDLFSQSPSEQLCSALNLLRSIMGAPEQQQLLNPKERPVSSMIYTNGGTLWMHILQRLGGGKTLNEVVSHIISHDRDLLPDNKRVRENTLSGNSTAYSQARKRLPLETIVEFSNRVCNYLGQISGNGVCLLIGEMHSLSDLRSFLCDTSTRAFNPSFQKGGRLLFR